MANNSPRIGVLTRCAHAKPMKCVQIPRMQKQKRQLNPDKKREKMQEV